MLAQTIAGGGALFWLLIAVLILQVIGLCREA